jgi:hypothetical protein
MLTALENGVSGAAAGATIYDSKADMDADTSQAANAMAWVLGDATTANNGVYQFDGTSTWTRLGDLPYSYITAANAGAGTANAIVATTSIPIPEADGAALILLNITATNTGPATVSFNGAAALNIKGVTGDNLIADDLLNIKFVAGFKSGDTFQLITDLNSARNYVLARSEADRSTAQADRAEAESDAAQTATAQAQDLVEAATAGFTGFPDGQAYDFGYVTDETTYFDQDWGSIAA